MPRFVLHFIIQASNIFLKRWLLGVEFRIQSNVRSSGPANYTETWTQESILRIFENKTFFLKQQTLKDQRILIGKVSTLLRCHFNFVEVRKWILYNHTSKKTNTWLSYKWEIWYTYSNVKTTRTIVVVNPTLKIQQQYTCTAIEMNCRTISLLTLLIFNYMILLHTIHVIALFDFLHISYTSSSSNKSE